LDKERDFQKEYKHNIKIWKKNRIENEQKIKIRIFKVKEENVKLKENTRLMKS
jgi:ribosome maturation factor RimP